MLKQLSKKILVITLKLTLLGIVIATLTIAGVWLYFAPQLPSVEVLQTVRLQSPLRIYTADQQLISTFGEKRRVPKALEEIPTGLQQAFIASEDDRFFTHPGVDWQGIARAVWELVRTGEKGQGGSTITQQLTRSFFLSNEKTYVRKLKEIMLALRIEREISKQEILELYLNKVFLGHRSYGVNAAAETYYGKTLQQLSIAEMAMIAGIVQRPSWVNPITNPGAAMQRRNYVLSRMYDLEFIDEFTYNESREAPISAFRHRINTDIDAPYLAEMARNWAVEKYGDAIYESGIKIITTIHSDAQRAADKAVRDGLFAYDHRHGWRGAEASIDLEQNPSSSDWQQALDQYPVYSNLQPGLVTESDNELALVYLPDGQTISLDLAAVEWANPLLSHDSFGPKPTAVDGVIKAGDIIRVERDAEGEWELSQLPAPQSALISLDTNSGAILALVGGLDYQASKFNRAIQAKRQPGSSFKPFIYAAAIESGYHPGSIINDAPVVFRNTGAAEDWRPQNFSRTYYGPTRMREAMVHSRNLISVRLLDAVGIRPALDFISRFGFDREQLPENLSMALGSANLSPLAMVEAYATLANGGYAVDAYWLVEMRNQDDQVLLSTPRGQRCELCPQPSTRQSPLPGTQAQSNPDNIADPVIPDTQLDLETDVDLTAPPVTPDAAGSMNVQTISDQAPELIKLDASKAFVGPPLPNYHPRVVAESTTYLVRSMMADVIRRGTGAKAMVLERSDLAGKTGTTNDQRDAWFSGFNNEIATTVWFGFDDFSPLGRRELGGQAALPIWIDYMRVALTDSPDQQPPLPPGVAQVWINPETGKLASPGQEGAIREFVKQEQLDSLQADSNTDQNDQQATDPYEIY